MTEDEAIERILDVIRPSEEKWRVRRALYLLPDRERTVLELRFGFGCEQQTLKEVGAQIGLSHERVRQLEHKALARVAQSLRGPG
jgi:RNA polymerase primary sigma factor